VFYLGTSRVFTKVASGLFTLGASGVFYLVPPGVFHLVPPRVFTLGNVWGPATGSGRYQVHLLLKSGIVGAFGNARGRGRALPLCSAFYIQCVEQAVGQFLCGLM
jgi:hypothetical protein